jgi:glutaminyl-peptide cyclotransferase
VSCGPEKKSDPITEPIPSTPPKPHVSPPEFNSDSAYSFIKTQADMGPRTPGSSAHEKCVAYLEAFFKRHGAEVKITGGNATTFDNKQWRIDNVIASFDPQKTERILLGAHYDSRPFADKDPKPENRSKPTPGVNDGASGVGVLMEIARVLKEKQPDVGIDIILFDLEDYGNNAGDETSWCLGSQSWSRNPHKAGYRAKYGIVLDMVGAKGAIFPKEAHSVFYASSVLNTVWDAATKLGYSTFFSNAQVSDVTDDHYFINEIAQIPCIDIIHYIPNGQYGEFFEHHHTTTDDLNSIDKTTLKAVGQTLLEVIYNAH